MILQSVCCNVCFSRQRISVYGLQHSSAAGRGVAELIDNDNQYQAMACTSFGIQGKNRSSNGALSDVLVPCKEGWLYNSVLFGVVLQAVVVTVCPMVSEVSATPGE